MEFFEVAKKYSYSDDIKINLFKNAYNSFPKEWKSSEAPFYYLCMEKPDLWEPVFGYSYDSNDAFEAAMKESYYSSLNL
jgi:spore photoproduct lyase